MEKAQPRKKRQTSAKAARTTKSKSSPKSVDEYIARLPEPAQTKLKQVRAAIRSIVPAETTEVVSYGIPAVQAEKSSGLVRRLCRSLEFVPHRGSNRTVQR